MKPKIFEDYGIEIYQEDNKYWIRYDDGGIASRMVEDEITKEQSIKAQKSEHDAYLVLLECEKDNDGVLNN